VFAGDFTFDAVEVVAATDDVAMMDGLDGLVIKSLVERSSDGSRYHLLEPIRQYAVAKLDASGESLEVHEAFLRWASGFTQVASRNLFVEQRTWTSRLDAERDNVGAAMAWALDHDQPDTAARMAGRLSSYWFGGNRNDALAWVPLLLTRLDELGPSARASFLIAAGITYCDAPDDPRPVPWLREAEDIARAIGHRPALGMALFWLCRAASIRFDDETAWGAIAEATALQEEVGNRFGWGWTMLWRSILLRRAGDFDQAVKVVLDVIASCDDVPHVVAGAWLELAQIDDYRGELDQAEVSLRRAIEAFRELGDRWQLGVALGVRSAIRVERDPSDAAAAAIDSIRTLRVVGAVPNLGRAVRMAAYLLHDAGQRSQAATLMGAISGLDQPLVLEHWAPSLHPMLVTTAAILDDPEWATERARGSRLGLVDACDAAVAWLEGAGLGGP
jgi:hypothetical protein